MERKGDVWIALRKKTPFWLSWCVYVPVVCYDAKPVRSRHRNETWT